MDFEIQNLKILRKFVLDFANNYFDLINES